MLKQPVRISLSDFIKTTMGSQFVIPVYQRIYTWSPEKETARFMNDIQDLLEKRTDNHFLGIIIYLDAEISAMFRQLQIVDGQQRLTTSFIFLLALKKEAEEKKDLNTAGMIDDYYLYNKHASEEGSIRLKPAVAADDVFARLVYGNEKDLTHKEMESAVYRNYDYIRRRIRSMEKSHSLIEILDVLSRIDILEFPLSEKDNTQQIFESINSTGAPLTSADLIRNYVLMNHTNEVQERYYSMYWQPMEEAYPESRKLEEFFRFYLAVKTYDLLNRRDVYEGFKKFWNENTSDTEDKLKEITRYCRYYQVIYEGPSEDAEIEKCLYDFRLSDTKTAAPFLMEIFHLLDEGEISSNDTCAEIRLIDSYLMRRSLCGMDSASLSRYFPSLLRSVLSAHRKNEKQDILSLTKLNLITYNRGKSLAMPTDEQLRTSMCEANAYAMMNIRTVLERIEHHGATARVDTSNLNIEHIMPQHPNDWWKKNGGARDDEEYTFLSNLIGNLTLCASYDNTRMGNEDFAFKKQILSKTLHIRMNTEILKKNIWNKQEILKRCQTLANEIIRIYPYNGANALKTENVASVKSSEDIYVLGAPTVNARAILHNDSDVEVLSGSTMKAYGSREMKKMRVLFQEMDEKGVFHEIDQGRIQFTQSYHFDSLNSAAQFLMHRGGENSSAWKKEQPSDTWENKKPSQPQSKKKPNRKPARSAEAHSASQLSAKKPVNKNKSHSASRTSSTGRPEQKKKTGPVSHKGNTGRRPSRGRNQRNARGIVPQKQAPVKDMPHIVRFAGMGQGKKD